MQVLYLEASDAVLVSRFSETRHRHPLQTRSGVQAGILLERERLARARELADHVIDTSGLSIGQLKEQLFRHVPRDSAADELLIDILTFGFKFGIPIDADLVFDVRFLTNPYYVPDLKPLSGLQKPVREFVLGQPAAGRFIELVVELLQLTVPAYRSEGKTRLTRGAGLHRRLPPLDRAGRGARRAAARASAASPSPSSTGSWSDEGRRACRAGSTRGCTSSAGCCSSSSGSPSSAWARRSSSSTGTAACRTTRSSSPLTGAGLDRPIRAVLVALGGIAAHRRSGCGASCAASSRRS